MEFAMPHVGGRPLSNRISTDLIEQLKTGDHKNSRLLPSEVELADRYGVSRSVIRDALGNLEREGFVERIRGVGTVIHREIVDLPTRLDLKYEYNELIRGMGYQPATDSVRVTVEAADQGLADKLQIAAGVKVLICEKRLLAGSTPVLFSIDRLPLALFEDIPRSAIDWSDSIFDILERHRGIIVDTDIARISSVIGTPAIRSRLWVPEGESLLLIDEVGYFKLIHPILQTDCFYTNFFDFTMLRKRFY